MLVKQHGKLCIGFPLVAMVTSTQRLLPSPWILESPCTLSTLGILKRCHSFKASISLFSSHLISISLSVLLTTAPETLILSTRNSLTRSSSFSLVVRLVSLSQRACSWRITRPVALPVATNLWRQRTWRTWSVKMQSSSHTLVSGLAVMSSEPLAQRGYCGLSLTEQLLCSTYL